MKQSAFLPLIFLIALFTACSDSDDEEFSFTAYSPAYCDYISEKALQILPAMYLTTDDGEAITSKTEYKHGTLMIDAPMSEPLWNLDTVEVNIRGRGNSTWLAPKKPLRIKLSRKYSLLGMPSNRDWVLLANWFDRSMLRTPAAFFLGQHSCLEWTPHGEFIELYLNGEYQGFYYLCEAIEIAKSRLNVPDNTFLLEVENFGKYSDNEIWFNGSYNTFVVKEPHVVGGDAAYNYVQAFIIAFEDCLISNNWLDEEQGYAKYIDMPTFVDWYLINEILKNTDATFYSSCFMYVTPGEPLKMGPLWDFDLSVGSTSNPAVEGFSGFWVNKGSWYYRLCQDEAFMRLVRERFDYFKDLMPELFAYINAQACEIDTGIAHNEILWHNLERKDSWVPMYGTFEREVQAIQGFLRQRVEWLDENLPRFDDADVPMMTAKH